MATSRYGNRYSSDQKRKDYSDGQRRAVNQDAYQVREMMYENNKRTQQRKEQQRKETASYQNTHSVHENNAMDRANREARRQNHENYTNRGYNREQEAFDRGRNPGADRMNSQRLKNERALNKGLNDLDRWGQNQRKNMSKNVPSTRPGESGREWEDHKYIDKVTTKNGKVRYIYDYGPSGGENRNSRQYKESRKKAKAEYERREQERLKNRSPQEVLRDTFNDTRKAVDKGINDARNAVDKGINDAKKAVSDGSKAVSDFLSKGLSNTPLADLFGSKSDNRLDQMQQNANKNRRPNTLAG